MNELMHSPMVTALCWTLLHSLWQALLFGLAAAIVRLSTRNAAPSLRYALLSGLLLLFFATTVFTCYDELEILAPVSRLSIAGQPWQAGNWISSHADRIVAVWLAVLVFKTARIGFTVSRSAYIRRWKSAEPAAYWKNKLAGWCAQLGISKQVALLETGMLRMPVVFGHLKPVIFVPLGMLTRLPADQAEAILLHELAHIARKDYLVNLFQCMMEALFFFNPGVLWLSSLVREEREHCCDDMAIGQTGNRKHYVETLISFRENMHYANTTFPGFSGTLPGRVRRIVTRQNETLTLTEKSWLAGCCLVTALLLLTVAQRPMPVKQTAEFPVGQVISAISDDLLESGVIKDKGDLSFELTNTQLLVNGRRQPAALWKKLNTKYLEASPYAIRPEHRKEPGFGIFFNATTHVYGIGTRPPAWGI